MVEDLGCTRRRQLTWSLRSTICHREYAAPGLVVATTDSETIPDAQPSPRPFGWTRLLLALTVCAALWFVILWFVIASHLGSYGAAVFVEGVVLWRGKPIDASVRAYPVLRDGTFGKPILVQHPSASPDAEFAIMSGRNWRRRYPAPNEVVLTVFAYPVDCSPEDRDRILLYDDPTTSPFRVIVDGASSGIVRIDLSSGTCELSAKSQPRK